ncbi:hypothetical protein [Clostridium sp. KNHs214]|uniref:hypothetical protein n=1 Tax=Clostridium sp. KNHs214 TaxID=1540257 RepID=UPI0005505AC6|nr:hypothetical protein [Clostridium sp. KNHs214]
MYVDIYTDNYYYDGYVYAVSDGIVVLELNGYYVAISTCKIISVGLEQLVVDGAAGGSSKKSTKLSGKTMNPIQKGKAKK